MSTWPDSAAAWRGVLLLWCSILKLGSIPSTEKQSRDAFNHNSEIREKRNKRTRSQLKAFKGRVHSPSSVLLTTHYTFKPESSQGSPWDIQYATALKPRASETPWNLIFKALQFLHRPSPSDSQFTTSQCNKTNKHYTRIKRKKNAALFKATQKLETTESQYYLASLSHHY